MIVFEITYDTSVVADFVPTFNSGYTYTTKTSTSGTLKTVTYESDTAFTTISIPNNNRSCVKSIYVDASGVTGLYNTFTGCQTMTDFTMVNASNKLTQLYQTTFDCTVLSNITYQDCDLSGVTNITNIFQTGAMTAVINATYKNVKFNNTSKQMISLLSKATTMVVEDCDFSSVTSYYQMFYNCVGLKGTLDLSMHDFTNVYETNTMFYGCTNLTKIIMPKGTFDKITTCEGMFRDCTSLIEVDLSGFHIPNAQKMSYMFSGCVLIEEIDLSALGVLNPTTINHMFVSCQKLKRVNLSGIKIPKAMSFSHMFYDSAVIEWVDISNVITRASDVTNFWKSGAVVNDIGMLYCPADVINAFANNMVSSGRTCNIYYHDAKLEDLTVDSRFNYIYCEEYHGDVVSTPDDLELYSFTDTWDNITITDSLDLTTGIVTKNMGILDITDINTLIYSGYDSTNDLYNVSCSFANFPNIVAKGNNTLASSNILEKKWYTLEGLYSHGIGNKFEFRISGTRGITSGDEAKQWVIDNLIMFYERTPEIIQLDINPLKSYRNGSIQTSSQQLAPTLKTTLPISNKFTTTNLTSGSTYNVYFDGTATKLDAGGTVITNPISPCEVECGGTTLTIEGTDIQNVRVLETSVKNEVGSVCGTTDVELNILKTRKYENLVDKKWSVTGSNWTLDEKTNTLFTNNAGRWSGIEVTTGAKYPKGISLVHVEFDVDTQDNRCAWISFGNAVGIGNVNFRDLKLSNDTARICQGNTSGIGQIFASYISKGHFSNLLYVTPTTDGKQRGIKFTIYTDSTPISSLVCTATNCAEGSTDGYTACADTGVTISNMRIRVVENYPDDTSFSQHASLIRQGTGQVIWQDMDMTMPYTNTYLARPVKLRSLGTTYDSYNPVAEELTKRIGVSETDGSYSVLSSPIITKITDSKLYRNIFNVNSEVKNWSSTPTINGNEMTFTGTYFTGVRVPKLITGKTYTLFYECVTGGRIVVLSNYTNQNSGISGTDTGGTWLSAGSKGIKTFTYTGVSGNGAVLFYANSSGTTYKNIMIVEGTFDNYEELPYFENEVVITYDNIKDGIPHLYTNGQVKVCSESDVYPTTILNGQSTNNYEINELNTSNNYTIRYEGECESINLANKSNTQGNNVLVKAGATSGNLTFVNDSGDIDNVLLVQNDVREQEINYFTGLQTVEISQLQISPSGVQNMFIQNTLNDFEKIGGHGLITENGYLELSHSSANQSGVFRTKETYTLKPKASILIRIVGTGYSTGTYQLITYIGDGKFVNQDQYCSNHTSLESIAKEISKNGYCDLILTNVHTESFTGQLTLANYFNQWIISHVAICDENVDYIEPTIIDLPQPVQLNSLPDGTCDTYNPITGEYVQNVGYFVLDDTFASSWRIVKTKDGKPVAQRDLATQAPHYNNLVKDYSFPAELYDYQAGTKAIANIPLMYNIDHDSLNVVTPSLYGSTYYGNYYIRIALPFTPNDVDQYNYSNTQVNDWLRENPIHIVYKRTEPITTQLTPVEIPTFEGGIVQLITTDGKVFPMIEYSMSTNNRYDTSSWEAGKVYTQRNMTEAYFNESTTPMTPTETMTLTTDHISSGSIILNDNGNGLIVLKGNYTGRDIPYFTGIRSVEAIEVETTPSPDQPLFGKGGRK